MLSRERQLVENHEKWREWCKDIPSLHFKEDWEVKVIPPFMGVLARFTVSKGDRSVSVYLDGDCDTINEPFYEIYDGTDVMRFFMDGNTKEMMDVIGKILDENYYIDRSFGYMMEKGDE